jgi:hypothetical protein
LGNLIREDAFSSFSFRTPTLSNVIHLTTSPIDDPDFDGAGLVTPLPFFYCEFVRVPGIPRFFHNQT